MLLGASGSFFTYEFRGRKITRFGNGLLSISADKSTNLSGSTDVLSVIADVVKDIDYDCSNRYNEIPGRTFLSESRHVPWIGGGKQYNYKFSPQCSLPFRRMDRDPRGYSRKVRNSPMDYSDEIYSSRSFSQIPNNNQYYYGSGQDAYDQNGRLVRIHRNKPINKFFGGEVGNPPDDLFISYGSGSVSSSWEARYDGHKITNRQYYQNNKNEMLLNSNGVRDCNAQYGSAMDSTYQSLILSGSLKDQLCGLMFNENFSNNNNNGLAAYIEDYLLASQSISHSFYPGDLIIKEKGASDYLASWYVGGRSGSFDFQFNNKDLGIPGETIIPNVAILKSYVSTNACYTASMGNVILSGCYGIPDVIDNGYFVFQSSCSLALNSVECLLSGGAITSYYEYIFSIKYPTINTSYESQHEGIDETQGLTLGAFVGFRNQHAPGVFYEFLFQLPIINFSVDGNIKIVAVDSKYKLKFVSSGKKWNNDYLYKVGVLLDFGKLKTISLMLNDEYICQIETSKIMAALVVPYLFKSGRLGGSGVIDDEDYENYANSVYVVQWAWFGSLYTAEYDEYNIFTIRNAKRFLHYGSAHPEFQDDIAYKFVNRFIGNSSYNGQLRKKHAGSVNFGSKLLNIDTSNNNVAVSVSCSDYSLVNLQQRPAIYPIDNYAKMFANNQKKTWEFFPKYFPHTAGF